MESQTISELPRSVQEFVCEHIRSVRQLEILLWLKLRKSGGTAEQIARELYSSQKAVLSELAPLVQAGLVQRDQSGELINYLYLPTRHDPAIDELTRIYGDFRVRIIELIFSRNSNTLKSFSDAFKLTEENNDG